ncbi:restriction endonuclease subunit S [Undibacterium umbellatum]|uniref:Restriction endonuclease subunit S n=1 Tax=Undibacterium umbellatum TaxID=2762300 RepID=A0ABR6ZJB8_9BURK|nr:restriction endonuclease subunit S [Undibacterium umbellatum]MBC3911342.1 restriction endonuclease subunit S [Undibacterium umbellatum]
MSRYKVYPEYKDAGVEWLDKVPMHWHVMQLKRTVDGCVNGIWGEEPQQDGNDTIVIRVADFDRQRLTINEDGYTFRRIEAKEKQNRRLKRGDLLLEKSGGGEKTLVGQVVLFDKTFEAVTSNFVAKMTPLRDFDSSYMNYVFSRFYFENLNFCSIKQNTGIQNLDSAAYLSEKIGIPKKDEQQKIANFLDHETAKIDTLIAKQQELIKLLKEKRQAVISHAVTKGLNPNAPMRDSGVEWLGEVPEHWGVKKFRFLCDRIIAGPFGSSITKDMYVKEGYKVYGQEQVIPNDFTIGDYYVSKRDFLELFRYSTNPGDILISCVGTFGKVAVFPNSAEPGIINPRLIKAEVKTICNPLYLCEFLKSEMVFKQFELLSRGGTMGVINIGVLNEILVACPPLEEQDEVFLFIKRQKEKFNFLIERANKQIELAQERRTALISAAVTGKIDVRDWQALSDTALAA